MLRLFFMLILMSILSAFAAADSDNKAQAIKAGLIQAFPSHIPDSVSKSPVDGFYEAVYGTQIIYVSDDGRYMMQGVLMDIENGGRNLTEAAARRARKKYLSAVEKQEAISFGAQKPRHTVTVFTDIDCGYCRKLHAEIDQYASYGIKVNYLLFPRSGADSPSYAKAVSVWCSEDRAQALTKAKRGENPATQDCQNPVAEHVDIGSKVGVTGTPALLTAGGELMPGYLPAQELAKRLDQLAGR